MDAAPVVRNAVKTAVNHGIAAGDVITVVGKLLTRGQTGSLTHDFVALDHQTGAVVVEHDPFSAQQGDRVIRGVVDRNEVDKGMRFVRRQRGATVVVTQFVEGGRQAGQFTGARHSGKETRECAGGKFFVR